MKNKIFFAVLISSLFVLFFASFFVIKILNTNFDKTLFANIKTNLETIEQRTNLDDNFFQNLNLNNLNLMLISPKGEVLYKSGFDFGPVKDNLSRPAVKEALKNKIGYSKKISNNLKTKYYYIAKQLPNKNILYLVTQEKTIYELFLQNSGKIFILLILIFVFVFFISLFLTKKLVLPINNINIDNIDLNNHKQISEYREIKPLLIKIYEQKKHLEKEKANLMRAENIRKDFTANVSHELKTPLQTISGYAELLKSGIPKKKDVVPFAEKIFSESFRMRKLVEDIINLSGLEAEEKDLQWQKINLLLICENVIDSLQPLAEKKDIIIKLIYKPSQKYEINSVAEVVHTIIHNLVDNAIKYNRQGGKIFIHLIKNQAKYKDAPVACIKVQDTGIGIAKENLPRIFERFYRVDKSRSKNLGGTGLGLSIVKHSVARIKAKISVNSIEGKGSEFTLEF
ncbi:MAG: ATP-binding protein [Treponemataceae bacterium]